MIRTFALALFVLASSNAASADDYRCEVLAVEGGAACSSASGSMRSLAAGDLVAPDDTVAVAEGGQLDLALDGDADNVVRVESGTRVTVKTLFPTNLAMDHGALYAKLKNLPNESSFQVTTPTAIAVVRGSEYRVAADRDGATEVLNFSDSPVYVSGLDASGEALKLMNAQRTDVRRGGPPAAPRAMSQADLRRGAALREAVARRADEFRASGRPARIQRMEQVKREHPERAKALRAQAQDKGGRALRDTPGRRADSLSQDAPGRAAEGRVPGGPGEDRIEELREKIRRGVTLNEAEKRELTQRSAHRVEGRDGKASDRRDEGRKDDGRKKDRHPPKPPKGP